MINYRISVFILSIVLLVACEPTGPVPGTKLEGQLTPAPADWQPMDAAEVIQLSTFDGYSVNLWGVATDGGYYVASSHGAESKWAGRILKNRDVRLRIEGFIYELRAVEVTDAVELESVRAAYKHKYDLNTEEDFPDAIVLRMDPRE